MKPVVAIVGRPNVGKSTLFNRLTAARSAIEEKRPGVTRDRLYGYAEWCGRHFIVVDTGGITLEQDDSLTRQVMQQVELAIAEASLILFLLDARKGPTATDYDIAELLRRSGKQIIPVLNKVDGYGGYEGPAEFYRLGLDDFMSISAAHGRGIGDLLDRICAELPAGEAEPVPAEAIKVALIGRPNVGKSSLLNAILGEQRVIVTEIPGTTRDSVDTWFEHDGRHYILIDTAGVRRKSRVKEAVEYYSVLRSLKAIERCDVAVLLLDGMEGITEQDQKLAGLVDRAGRALVLAVNKWDLVSDREEARRKYLSDIKRNFVFTPYARMIFISARTGRRIEQLLPLVYSAAQELYRRVPTSLLNELMQDAVAVTPPPTVKGKRLKIYYATQPQIRPPSFVLFVNDPALMHFSYRRYLENRLRESFGFEGTPIRIILKQRSSKGE